MLGLRRFIQESGVNSPLCGVAQRKSVDVRVSDVIRRVPSWRTRELGLYYKVTPRFRIVLEKSWVVRSEDLGNAFMLLET
jgi:hypothetical protein